MSIKTYSQQLIECQVELDRERTARLAAERELHDIESCGHERRYVEKSQYPECMRCRAEAAEADLAATRAATDAAERERDGLRAAHAQVCEGLRQTREGWKDATADLVATRTALEQAERDNRSYLAELAILRPQLDEARNRVSVSLDLIDALVELQAASWSRQWSRVLKARERVRTLTGIEIVGPLRHALKQEEK